MRFLFICISLVLSCVHLILAQEGFILQDTIYISDNIPQLTIQNTSQNVLSLDSIRVLNYDEVDSPFDTMTLSFATECYDSGRLTYDIFGNRDSNNNRIAILPGSDCELLIWPSIFPDNIAIHLICAFFVGGFLDTLNVFVLAPLPIRHSPRLKKCLFQRSANESMYSVAGRKIKGPVHSSIFLLSPGSSNLKPLNRSGHNAK